MFLYMSTILHISRKKDALLIFKQKNTSIKNPKSVFDKIYLMFLLSPLMSFKMYPKKFKDNSATTNRLTEGVYGSANFQIITLSPQ